MTERASLADDRSLDVRERAGDARESALPDQRDKWNGSLMLFV